MQLVCGDARPAHPTALRCAVLRAQVHSLDEAEAFCSISAALLVNMGTLSPEWVASKKLAAKQVLMRARARRAGAQAGWACPMMMMMHCTWLQLNHLL